MATRISGSVKHITTGIGNGVSINLNSLLHILQLASTSNVRNNIEVGCHTGRVYSSCAMQASQGSLLNGFVDFAQNVNDRCEPLGNLEIKVSLRGLPATDNILNHGLHIHELGDLSDGCASTGGHYNPFNNQHGGPSDQRRHVGDLGNVREDGFGNINTVLSDSVVSIVGPYSINGRAVVIHEKEDDLGLGSNSASTTTGNAGARIGCCVIGNSNGMRWQSTLRTGNKPINALWRRNY